MEPLFYIKSEMSKHDKRNGLSCTINFIFPKTQERDETYVSKHVKFKVFVDEECVGEVGKNDHQTFIANMKTGAKFDVMKANIKEVKVFSSFSWIVGEKYATLYLDQDTCKKVKLNFANQNRVEIYDERDWDFIDENGEITNQKREAEVEKAD